MPPRFVFEVDPVNPSKRVHLNASQDTGAHVLHHGTPGGACGRTGPHMVGWVLVDGGCWLMVCAVSG